MWGKNLGNRWSLPAPSNYYFYFLTAAEFAALTPAQREVERGVITPPRQVGVTFSYRFE